MGSRKTQNSSAARTQWSFPAERTYRPPASYRSLVTLRTNASRIAPVVSSGAEQVVRRGVGSTFDDLRFGLPLGVANQAGQSCKGLMRSVSPLDGDEQERRKGPGIADVGDGRGVPPRGRRIAEGLGGCTGDTCPRP